MPATSRSTGSTTQSVTRGHGGLVGELLPQARPRPIAVQTYRMELDGLADDKSNEGQTDERPHLGVPP